MLTGFGNHFSSEAVAGALPIGRNSPQKVPFGLYAEQFSGTAFTAPRADNRRTWLYRMRPAASHPAYALYTSGYDSARIASAPVPGAPTPNRLRWDPLGMPAGDVDFVDGLVTYGGNGDVGAMSGVAIHLYAATASMRDRVFQCSDGELLIVPQQGALDVATELGRFAVAPGSVAVVPRGLRFRVDVPDGGARGYVCENYGQPFALPDLGPIGANGLANARDFETPDAWYEDADRATEIVQKFGGALWATTIGHSPLDVVAWHGNLVPYRYDLARFNTMGTVSFDHPDPSIFTVLTSASELPGTANCDFVIFPPRWLVATETFRPPWFHRNVMSEFMGLIEGAYDAREGGFSPGGASLHNQMNGHGPDQAAMTKAIEADLKPVYLTDTMAFMFESRLVIRPTAYAMDAPHRQTDYESVWSDFAKAVVPA